MMGGRITTWGNSFTNYDISCNIISTPITYKAERVEYSICDLSMALIRGLDGQVYT